MKQARRSRASDVVSYRYLSYNLLRSTYPSAPIFPSGGGRVPKSPNRGDLASSVADRDVAPLASDGEYEAGPGATSRCSVSAGHRDRQLRDLETACLRIG